MRFPPNSGGHREIRQNLPCILRVRGEILGFRLGDQWIGDDPGAWIAAIVARREVVHVEAVTVIRHAGAVRELVNALASATGERVMGRLEVLVVPTNFHVMLREVPRKVDLSDAAIKYFVLEESETAHDDVGRHGRVDEARDCRSSAGVFLFLMVTSRLDIEQVVRRDHSVIPRVVIGAAALQSACERRRRAGDRKQRSFGLGRIAKHGEVEVLGLCEAKRQLGGIQVARGLPGNRSADR